MTEHETSLDQWKDIGSPDNKNPGVVGYLIFERSTESNSFHHARRFDASMPKDILSKMSEEQGSILVTIRDSARTSPSELYAPSHRPQPVHRRKISGV